MDMSEQEQLSMKLLHYFITKKNYNPIIVQGVTNEIWLENLNSDYKVIRIVNNYLHNNEQLEFDVFKTKRMVQKIKRKTLTYNIKVLTILTDVGENVSHEVNVKNDDIVFAKNEQELLNSLIIENNFSDLKNNMQYNEDGLQLFLKITGEINEKNKKDAINNDKIFEPKPIIVTYILLAILSLIFLISFIFNYDDMLVYIYGVYGPQIRNGEYYRLLTGTFIHVDILHLLTNDYALYIIGSQIENFYGKKKFIIIYLVSAICGSLLSICMHDSFSIGASGAIFGLLGSLLYFGYYYRVYFGSIIINKVLPVIGINLLIGFMLPGIDNYAHLGGLIGGILISMAVGIGYRDEKRDHVNGWVLLAMFIGFLTYLAIFMK